MTKPQNGAWKAIFVSEDGKTVHINMELQFHDDGRVTGSFTVTPIGSVKWTGPLQGTFKNGGYSPFGSLHLEEDADSGKCGHASFDGTYQASPEEASVISGTVLITKEAGQERGTLSAVYAYSAQKVALGHVWGN